MFYTIFGGQNAILVFYTTCTWDKKLCCGLVRDKNMSFCPVPCLQFVLYLKQFYKSNTGQLELFCPVLHFLANQTHPRGVELIFTCLVPLKVELILDIK